MTRVISKKKKSTAMMGMALLVNCEPLTSKMAQGLSRLMAPTSTAPVSTERQETPEEG